MYFWYYTAALWAMHEMVLSCISGAHSHVEKLKTYVEKLRIVLLNVRA